MPHIGDLDKRVQLRAPTQTRGASGGVTYPYTTFATVWAKVEMDQDGMEIVEGGKLQPRRFWKLTIRRRTDITAKQQVVYQGKTLHVKGVGDSATREEFMVILATENAP